METILASVITGAVTLLGILIAGSRAQAVTEAKLEALTREVRELAAAARKMPVMEEQLKGMSHRMNRLEGDKYGTYT